PVHSLKDSGEIFLLQREQFFERLLARSNTVSENHLAHSSEPSFAEEHVLGAAKTYAFSAKLARNLRVVRRVCVGANSQASKIIRPTHQLREVWPKRRLSRRHL